MPSDLPPGERTGCGLDDRPRKGRNARCWVNKYGSYVPNRGFIPAEGYSADEDAIKEYVKGMNSLLKTKLSYATSIVDYNYYNYLKNYLK